MAGSITKKKMFSIKPTTAIVSALAIVLIVFAGFIYLST